MAAKRIGSMASRLTLTRCKPRCGQPRGVPGQEQGVGRHRQVASRPRWPPTCRRAFQSPPHQRFAAGQADLGHTHARRRHAPPRRSPPTQDVFRRQAMARLPGACSSGTQVAAVRDRDSQVVDGSSERINHPSSFKNSTHHITRSSHVKGRTSPGLIGVLPGDTST